MAQYDAHPTELPVTQYRHTLFVIKQNQIFAEMGVGQIRIMHHVDEDPANPALIKQAFDLGETRTDCRHCMFYFIYFLFMT